MDASNQAHCEACRVGAPPATPRELEAFLSGHPDWTLRSVEGVPRLERTFRFPDFASAMAFAAAVGELAEAENHHPSLQVDWGRARVRWWTHKISNVHRNDVLMAARTDALFQAAQPPPSARQG